MNKLLLVKMSKNNSVTYQARWDNLHWLPRKSFFFHLFFSLYVYTYMSSVLTFACSRCQGIKAAQNSSSMIWGKFFPCGALILFFCWLLLRQLNKTKARRVKQTYFIRITRLNNNIVRYEQRKKNRSRRKFGRILITKSDWV